jgi:hypothetical protein
LTFKIQSDLKRIFLWFRLLSSWNSVGTYSYLSFISWKKGLLRMNIIFLPCYQNNCICIYCLECWFLFYVIFSECLQNDLHCPLLPTLQSAMSNIYLQNHHFFTFLLSLLFENQSRLVWWERYASSLEAHFFKDWLKCGPC